jgi:F0F1-type ATP synthase gamma subunit
MADIFSALFSTINNLVNTNGLSKAIGEKTLSKIKSISGKSLLSIIKDFGSEGSAEHNEEVEKMKKKPIFERVNYLYGDKTFSGRYGIDIIKVCVVIFLFMSAVTYYQIQNKLLEVKRDWPEYRCRPDVMPFAGWINAPEGVSPLEYTKQNFMECGTKVTKGIYDSRMSMVYQIFNVVVNIFKNILEVIEKIRLLFNRMRDALKDIFLSIFHRIQNVVIPIQKMLIKMVDFFEKIKGILATFLLTFIGVLWSFYSLIGSIYELVVIILVIMIVVIIVLWYIPFVGWALAIAAIAVFLTIAIPLIMLGIVSRQITRQRTSRLPSPDD